MTDLKFHFIHSKSAFVWEPRKIKESRLCEEEENFSFLYTKQLRMAHFIATKSIKLQFIHTNGAFAWERRKVKTVQLCQTVKCFFYVHKTVAHVLFYNDHLKWSILHFNLFILRVRLYESEGKLKRFDCVKGSKIILQCFFSFSWVFFHEHSRFTWQQGKGEAISLKPPYHFHPLHRYLDISQAITTESSLTSAHS